MKPTEFCSSCLYAHKGACASRPSFFRPSALVTAHNWEEYLDNRFTKWRVIEDVDSFYHFTIYVPESLPLETAVEIEGLRQVGLSISFITMNWFQRTFWKNRQWLE